MQATYDERKLTELLLYVAERLTTDVSGAAKIDKVLYFADFAHVRRTGSPITGAEYHKLHDGPAPRRLKPIRDALVECGDAEISMEDFLGYSLHRLTPRRAADTSIFSEVELATIDKVIDDLHGLNAQQVSDLSRGRPAGASSISARRSRTSRPCSGPHRSRRRQGVGSNERQQRNTACCPHDQARRRRRRGPREGA